MSAHVFGGFTGKDGSQKPMVEAVICDAFTFNSSAAFNTNENSFKHVQSGIVAHLCSWAFVSQTGVTAGLRLFCRNGVWWINWLCSSLVCLTASQKEENEHNTSCVL